MHGLEGREGLLFFRYPFTDPLPIDRYLLLGLEGEPLSHVDSTQGLLLLDSTWNYLPMMHKAVRATPSLQLRTLPAGWVTAYPRRQEGCADPLRGLATVEALVAAHVILGRSIEGLLDHYYWKEKFIYLNSNNF